MSKQAIEQIKATEKNAQDIILNAQLQAEKMIADAKADIEKKRAQDLATDKSEYKEAMQGVSMQLGIMRESAAKEAEKKAEALKQKYDGLFDAAAELAAREALK